MTPAARRIALVLLATIYGFGFIDRIVIALVAQQLKADYALSDFDIGLLSGTAFAVVNTFASVPLARLAERFPRKWVVTGSLLVAAVFTALCAATTSFVQLLALRLGMAGGSAGTEAPSHSTISDMYPPAQRASAISLFMLGIPVASILGSTIGGTIAQYYGWRATFLVIGITGLVVTLLSLALIREPQRSAPAPDEASIGVLAISRIMLGDRCLRQILIGVSILGLGSFGMNTFLPPFFSRNFGLGAGSAGLYFGLLSGIASAVGAILGGYGSEWLAKRDPRWLIAAPGLGAIIGAPLFATGLFQHSLALAFPLMLLGSCFFYTAMGPSIAVLHGLLDSRSRATGSALFLLVLHLIGQGFGPPLAGWVSDTVSAATFGSSDFATLCAGAAGQVPGSACAAAAATGVRYAIACFGLLYAWSGLHLLWAARHRKVAATAAVAA